MGDSSIRREHSGSCVLFDRLFSFRAGRQAHTNELRYSQATGNKRYLIIKQAFMISDNTEEMLGNYTDYVLIRRQNAEVVFFLLLLTTLCYFC